jgi:drug/metabolite transporter (DMT)-like permease
MSICIVSSGMVADYLIWGHFPNMLGLVGIIFVVLGGSLTVYFGQQELLSNQALK